jgi:glutamine cyclotransferase
MNIPNNSDTLAHTHKIKLVVLLLLSLFLGLSLFLVFLGSKETKLMNDSVFDSSNEGDYKNSNSEILFETSDYIVIKKIRRYDRYFTQGLFMDSENTLIESSGLYGQSTLQKYEINTPDQKIFKFPIDRNYFAEGVCLYKNKIFQLTWREREMYHYYF